MDRSSQINLRIDHLNPQSLSAQLKDIRSITDEKNLHVLGVDESWLRPTVLSKSVKIERYNLVRHDCPGDEGCGGVAIYLRDGIHFTLLFTSRKLWGTLPDLSSFSLNYSLGSIASCSV